MPIIKIDVTKHKLGTPGNDWLYGYDEDVIFHHSAGDDHYFGGLGFDTLTYANSDKAVIVDARGPAGWAGFMGSREQDVFQGIERIVGSSHDDIFWAGDTTEIHGGGGDDWIVSGAGANVLNGGTGSDTVSYTDSTEKVDVQLAYYSAPYAWAARAKGGYAEGDTLIGIENVRGSNFDDYIAGDPLANKLEGNGGHDQLFGKAGDDKLYGDEGHDWLYGDAGSDRLDGGEGNDWLFGGDGNDALEGGEGVDWLDGGYGDDALSGGAGTDNVFGFFGNDMLLGGGGNDALNGGGGEDVLIGGEGADELNGGNGADQFVYTHWLESPNTAGGLPGGSADRIIGFNAAEGDKINLAYIDDANWNLPGNQGFSPDLLQSPYPNTDPAFSAGKIAVSHMFNDTYVQINLNDNANAEGWDPAEMVIVLDGWHDLTADDFVLGF